MLAGGVSITEERRKLVDFTGEVFPGRGVVVTRRSPLIQNLELLRRARVGTMKGSSWAEIVADLSLPAGNVDDSFGTPEDVLQLAGLITGR